MIQFHQHLGRIENAVTHPAIADLKRWRDELAPADLSTRVQDLTARDDYDDEEFDGEKNAYETAVTEVLASPESLRGLETWLNSEAAKGESTFGFRIGPRRQRHKLRDWCVNGCRPAIAARSPPAT